MDKQDKYVAHNTLEFWDGEFSPGLTHGSQNSSSIFPSPNAVILLSLSVAFITIHHGVLLGWLPKLGADGHHFVGVTLLLGC